MEEAQNWNTLNEVPAQVCINQAKINALGNSWNPPSLGIV